MNVKPVLVMCIVVLLSNPAVGQELLEIRFNDVPDVACDEIWVQSGVNISVTSTTAEDCDGGGNCTWIPWDGNSGIGMAPARLTLDFGESYLIYSVEIDVTDYCGDGCTRAFLYNNGEQVGFTANVARGTETLVVQPTGGYADSMAVSSCEGVVLGQTIRIYSEVVAAESATWGAVKSVYR